LAYPVCGVGFAPRLFAFRRESYRGACGSIKEAGVQNGWLQARADDVGSLGRGNS